MLPLRKMIPLFVMQYRKAYIIFWGILLIVITDQSLVRGFFRSEGRLNDSLPAAITAVWIFVLVTSIYNATHLFSLMMNYSVTRKSYYKTLVIWSTISCILMSLFTVMLVYGVVFIAPWLGVQLAAPSANPVIMFYHLFTTSMIVSALSLITGALFYFYHFIAGIASLLLYYALFYQYLFHNFVALTQIDQPMWMENHLMLILSCILLGLGWVFYRRGNVSTKKK
ncbi:hypothetical protein J2Z32_002265 [Paenibacillus turicensis]|uniref:ABC transporter permease n=2 Tax=Paenibacillus turicensis TaxID=160487 RepID=A0ABS4FSV8_9BACL|nr:hypothetical protein [Paenibacillus turicensis]